MVTSLYTEIGENSVKLTPDSARIETLSRSLPLPGLSRSCLGVRCYTTFKKLTKVSHQREVVKSLIYVLFFIT
jgi:hypothetical protein